ncbi:MAG: LuxR C-terminal-related transcriptional regulator [Acidimicrobiales bacterium]
MDNRGAESRQTRRIILGERPFVLPVGTVTFVLADVEGSTRLWAETPDDMAAAMTRLNATVDDLVGRHEGVRPLEQGEGDSFVAAFARPSDAGAFALELADELRDGLIRLRMGIHTGEVELRDEENYMGTTLNRVARLRDAGHGGQILCSRATIELLAERLPGDAVLDDLGAHRLRDIARPERIWSLRRPHTAPELRPLRTLDTRQHNLPAQLTTFVGRRAELAVLDRLLAETRVLSLLGSGGCGKTRLALELASRTLDRFRGGAWLVELAPVADADRVETAVADAMRVSVPPHEEPVEAIGRRVGDQATLIILDNCEHVLEGAVRVADALVRASPSVTVVATSREPLSLQGEAPFRVPSLGVPDARSRADIETVGAFEAVELFIDRAIRARPNFIIDNESAPLVAEICERLDGIPLAIELAAARCRMLTTGQIRDGLVDRFRLLTGGARTLTPRQQTLRASIDWSYDLLGDRERLLLDRLSVFSGSFTLAAAEAVCGDDRITVMEILDALAALVDRSLVLVNVGEQEARYRMLESVRQYGMERLIVLGTFARWRTRHRDYFASVASSATREEMAEELDNLRAAIEWSRTTDDTETAMAIVADLLPIWSGMDHALEAARTTSLLLAAREGVQPAVVARTLLVHAFAGFRGAPGVLTAAAAEEATTLAKGAGDVRTAGRALWLWGTVATTGAPVRGERLIEESLELIAETDDSEFRVLALCSLGAARYLQGRLGEGRALLESAIAGDPDVVFGSSGSPTFWLANLEIHRGQWEAVITHGEAVHSSARQSGVPVLAAFGKQAVGLARAMHGDVVGALRERDAVLEILELVPEPIRRGTRGWVELIELQCALQIGDHAAARAPLSRMLADPGVSVSGAFSHGGATMLAIAEGRLDDAEGHLTSLGETPHPLAAQFGRWLRARLARLRGDPQSAENLAHDALTQALAMDVWSPWGGVPPCLEVIAEAAKDLESWDEASRIFGAVDALRAQMGLPRNVAEAAEAEAAINTIRAVVSPARLAALLAEGAAMSADEVIAYSRRGRGDRKRPSSGWASLTPSEQQVVDLVVAGLTNKQIGERLFLSARTVGTHLTHVYAKLGVASRTQLATAALERVRS